MCHDILAGIFYYLKEKNVELESRSLLHETIFELKNTGKFSLLDDFNFSTDSIFPISDEIEDSLFSLQLSHMIYFKNPKYVKIELRDESRPVIEERIFNQKFSPQDNMQIVEIADAFKKLFGANDVPKSSYHKQ